MQRVSKSELNRLVGQQYNSVEYKAKMRQAQVNEQQYRNAQYDVFLSHSYDDREAIFQLNYFMEERLGLSVFVDWIESPEIDRKKVTPETAETLRDVMNRCASLVYAVSENAASSKWMPWELGYSDGKHGKVAVLPIGETTSTAAAYANQEFVGIYPFVEIENDTIGIRRLWVRKQQDRTVYASLDEWRNTGRLIRHG